MDGITFVTTDSARWGTGQGSPLTAPQADLNLWELLSRLQGLEANPPTPAEITNITVVGSVFKFILSNGLEFGPYTMPTAVFRARGEWTPNTQYFQLDIITVRDYGAFMVNFDHLSADTFDPLATNNPTELRPLYHLIFGETGEMDVSLFFPGAPGSGIAPGDTMLAKTFSRAVSFPQDFAASKAQLWSAPTQPLTLPVYKDDSEIGAIDFAADEYEGTFAMAAGLGSFTAGQTLRVLSPDPATDARDLTITLVGRRGLLRAAP
jgi:hypothetical protein